MINIRGTTERDCIWNQTEQNFHRVKRYFFCVEFSFFSVEFCVVKRVDDDFYSGKFSLKFVFSLVWKLQYFRKFGAVGCIGNLSSLFWIWYIIICVNNYFKRNSMCRDSFHSTMFHSEQFQRKPRLILISFNIVWKLKQFNGMPYNEHVINYICNMYKISRGHINPCDI